MRDRQPVEMLVRGDFGEVTAVVIAEVDAPSIEAATVDSAVAAIAGNLSLFGMRLVMLPPGVTLKIRRRRWWRPYRKGKK